MDYYTIATTVIAAAAILANLTPNESDNKAITFLAKLINFFAVNFHVKGNLDK